MEANDIDNILDMVSQKESVETKLAEHMAKNRAPDLEYCKKIIRLYKFTADELEIAPVVEKNPPLFRSPDGKNTWTGKGISPIWLNDWLTENPKKTLADLAIDKARYEKREKAKEKRLEKEAAAKKKK